MNARHCCNDLQSMLRHGTSKLITCLEGFSDLSLCLDALPLACISTRTRLQRSSCHYLHMITTLLSDG